MKKLIALLLAMTMMLSLGACGTSGGKNSNTAQTNQTAADDNPYYIEELKWPSETITIWCGYSAGGSSDLLCRGMAEALQRELGVNVIVENAPGASSWKCWTSLQQTLPKDGYNLTLVNSGIVTGKYDPSNPRPYYVDDFAVLCSQVVDYEGIAIRTSENRFSDLASMIEYGKENEMYITASSGYFAGDGCIAQWLNSEYGTHITAVPVDGAGDQRTMFLAGDTDILVGNVSDLMSSGYGTDWEIICVFSDERLEQLPDVPTSKEEGFDYFGFSARGFAYAKGVDERIVTAMQEAMVDIFNNDQTYIDFVEGQGNNMVLWLGDELVGNMKEKAQHNIDVWNLGINVE